ncbi:hypothetical protein [Chryseobacterium indoltheticum]|uniref:hypothetical protein n=1 Tax=Chryseobacterium indoltheticum TaxID=254 RepID=UPI00242F54AD|nr:hypothetical protein [Chryseobacterium indoltheticum]MDF2832773.1 hypothetical protein [Chryseobacterium indoltheticum]
MKIFRLFIYFSIIFLILFSCKKNNPADVSQLYGLWKIKSDSMGTKESLNLNTDKTFTYKSSGHIAESFSFGKWEVVKDTLILNSVMPKECYYVLSFGGKCKSSHLFTDELIRKTILECESPALNNFFIEFENSKIIITKDSLVYKITHKNCKEVPYEITLYR